MALMESSSAQVGKRGRLEDLSSHYWLDGRAP